jgi:hypothetical protein
MSVIEEKSDWQLYQYEVHFNDPEDQKQYEENRKKTCEKYFLTPEGVDDLYIRYIHFIVKPLHLGGYLWASFENFALGYLTGLTVMGVDIRRIPHESINESQSTKGE